MSAPSFHEAHLLVVNPSGNRSRVKLEPLPFTIGRQSGNQLVLRDNRASRNHARIVVEDGSYFIEDCNSRNGVTVNGDVIQGRRPLHSGDAIEFGVENSYRLVFTLEESELLKLMSQFHGDHNGGGLGKLRALVEVARTVQSSLSVDYVLSAVVDAALSVTSAERGLLLLNQDGEFRVAVARSHDGITLDPQQIAIPPGVVKNAVELRDSITMERDGVICVPLIPVRPQSTEDTVAIQSLRPAVGAICLESRGRAWNITSGDHELLETLATEASTILENARLLEQERLRQKMEEELSIARKIQQSLMPRSLPETGWFRAAMVNIPTHKVGGDYCDVAPIADRWGFVVADVSGKGVSAALLAALLQGAFFAGGQAAARMDDIMRHVNRFLTERTQGEKYATLFAAVLDANGALRWTNAGHCPALLIRCSGAIEKLEPTSMPIGMLEEAEFEVCDAKLEPGDKILAYSDGVTDAQGRDAKPFGARRVERFAAEHYALSCQDLVASLIRTVDEFNQGTEQEDDITVLCAEFARA